MSPRILQIALFSLTIFCACSSSTPPGSSTEGEGEGAGEGEDEGEGEGQDLGGPTPADAGEALDAGVAGDATPEQPDVGGGAVDQGTADGGEPPACQPNPFVAPGAPTDWLHWETGLTVVQGAANHRGQDVVVPAGAPQLLIGKFAYGIFDKDLKDEEVEVFVQHDPPCGEWVSLGVVLTSEEGEYGNQYGIEDDGGRVFFEIPAEQALPVGVTPVRMLVHGDLSTAAFSLWVLEPSTPTVVFDIDGTLTTDDFQLISELFTDVFNGRYVPAMQPGALDVVQAWADLGYVVLYITGRPDWLRRQSRGWLVDEGFPPGPLHLTDTNLQALPTAAGVGQYKTDYLELVASQDPAAALLYAAYGNAATDIQAYAATGVPKERTFILGANGGNDGTVALPGYPDQLPAVEAMPDAVPAAPGGGAWEWEQD